MKIDIAACIRELLFEHESVIVPGFGGFVASYKPAVIDHVQGTLAPPAKKLQFNENLLVNDGLLLQRVIEKYQLKQEEATKAIEAYVDEMLLSLSKREIVEIPEVGRLYKDFEDQYKFLQDSKNYNADAFGLPAIHFYPVIRQKREYLTAAQKASGAKRATVKPVAASDRKLSFWLQRSMPIIVILSLVIILVSIYFIRRDFANRQAMAQDEQTMPVNRINTKPPLEEDDEFIIVDEDEMPLTDEEEGASPEEEVDTEAPTQAPNAQEAIIIIGAFRDIDNAEKLIQKIYEAGYDAFTDQQETKTRVGVQFGYEDPAKVDRVLKDIREQFNPKAWVYRSE